MRFVWLGALGVLAVVMAVLTPYVFRTESTWQAAAWLVMLIATVTGTAVLTLLEVLFRRMEPPAGSDVSDT
ncbi:hypothetical protein JG491_33560 [Streptomyces sp. CRPSP2-6A1]|uniref:hypothetical protein n=1 Tax=Streptomyces TaxID=1883 RepID=UPI0018F0EB05|nr:hypothetical protein [Streptomyces sp. CRPSP2-6A1]MBJ7004933.1 hypothetical protein [Streptomyces sp. CRPSP2-6A1]